MQSTASKTRGTFLGHVAANRLICTEHYRLTISYRQDSSEPSPLGYYHYDTTDGGKTWKYAKFEKDDLNDAFAPDAAALRDAIKTAN